MKLFLPWAPDGLEFYPARNAEKGERRFLMVGLQKVVLAVIGTYDPKKTDVPTFV